VRAVKGNDVIRLLRVSEEGEGEGLCKAGKGRTVNVAVRRKEGKGWEKREKKTNDVAETLRAPFLCPLRPPSVALRSLSVGLR
jgi:hypothetical protein